MQKKQVASTKSDLYVLLGKTSKLPKIESITVSDLENAMILGDECYLPSKNQIKGPKIICHYTAIQLHVLINFFLFSKYMRILPFESHVNREYYLDILFNDFPEVHNYLFSKKLEDKFREYYKFNVVSP